MLLIGNFISFIAAIFMIASCIVKEKEQIFIYQFLECMLLAFSSIFFGSISGVTTLVCSAGRNLLVAKNKFTKMAMYLFVVLTFTTGMIANTKGIIGLLPIIATIEYTICCHYIKGVTATKYSIFVNVFIWIIYSFAIYDFSTGITDVIVLIIDTFAIIKIHLDNRKLKYQDLDMNEI